MTAPYLVGYDLRVDPAVASLSWGPERRRQFLLRQDVAHPLSVDPMVWPSRFWQLHVPPGMGVPRHVGTVAVPPGTPAYSSLGLWTDLACLRAFASEARLDAAGPALAILAWTGDAMVQSFAADEPAALDGWRSLGFDVADASLVSGLANCGYGDERAALAVEWASRLNAHGLLETPDAAFAFRDLTDARVLEHAPFLVFELRTPASGTSG